jgi:hypothetical protein
MLLLLMPPRQQWSQLDQFPHFGSDETEAQLDRLFLSLLLVASPNGSPFFVREQRE